MKAVTALFHKLVARIKRLFCKIQHDNKFGWLPQLKDHRDIPFVPCADLSMLPRHVDLRSKCPPVYHQGRLGSCTANGVAFAHQFSQMKQKRAQVFQPSRLAIYYDARGQTAVDSGANIRDAIKVINKQGAAAETLWPYDEGRFAKKPSGSYYQAAKKHQCVKYKAVAPTAVAIKACLADGYPVVFGFPVYAGFMSQEMAATGVMTAPQAGEKLISGHCSVFVGYDDRLRVFMCRNSWGADWGDCGYFTMPYAFAVANASDLWQISALE